MSQGYRQATITTWLTRAGSHAQSLHEHFFCHLHLPHLQLDELRTRLRCATQVLWLWLAIDPLSKILPVLHVGPRTQNAAHRVIHSLRELLAADLASPSSPVTDSISTFMRSRPTLVSGSRWFAQGATCASGK